MSEPAELDTVRAAYVKQIMEHVRNPRNEDGGSFMVNELLMEWGAKAYYQGREHMAERIKKCADDWKRATG